MRIALPVLFLLFGASAASGQTQTPRAPVEAAVPAAAPATVQPIPAATPAPAAATEEPTTVQASTRAEAAAVAERTEAQEPRRRSRVVWFLVGAVVVLALIVATQ